MIFFLAFGTVVSMGLLNLLTAVFVDSLLAENKRQEIRTKQALHQAKGDMINLLHGLFTTFDTNTDNSLDAEELLQVVRFLKDSDTEELFRNAGLDTEQIILAIKLADHDEETLDGGSHITYDDFVIALESLNDQTQKQDIWMVQLKCKELKRQLLLLNRATKSRNEEVDQRLTALEHTNARQTAMLEAICTGMGLSIPEGSTAPKGPMPAAAFDFLSSGSTEAVVNVETSTTTESIRLCT